jgi:hypothetical protein
MTKNGHDCQQNIPVCFLYLWGRMLCIFCVRLLGLSPLFLQFSYFWMRPRQRRHNNICCDQDQEWSWSSEKHSHLLSLLVGMTVVFLLCLIVEFVTFVVLTLMFCLLWYYMADTTYFCCDHDQVWSWSAASKQNNLGECTRVTKGDRHLFMRLIVAFVVLSLLLCLFCAATLPTLRLHHFWSARRGHACTDDLR